MIGKAFRDNAKRGSLLHLQDPEFQALLIRRAIENAAVQSSDLLLQANSHLKLLEGFGEI